MRAHWRAIATLIGLLAVSTPAAAQIGVPGSEKETISILSAGQTINVEISQAKLGINFVKELACLGLTGEELNHCLGSVGRNHLDLTGRFAASAKDGQRTIIAGGDLTPGLEFGGAVAYYWEKDQGGYFALYSPLVAKLTQVKLATFAEGVPTSLEDKATRSLGTGIGITYAPRESLAFGTSVAITRLWDSPGLNRPIQVCTHRREGLDEDGTVVRAAKCDDRVVAALVDETVIEPRVEMVLHIPRVDSKKPTFGFVTSVSGSKRSAKSMAYNVALGPTLHPVGKPREVAAALLLSFADFTNANKRDITFKDMFSVKLFLAFPLTAF